MKTDYIEGLRKNIGCFFTEKADAGKAILEACRQMTSPNPIPLGEYRGFGMELLFDTIGRNYVIEI